MLSSEVALIVGAASQLNRKSNSDAYNQTSELLILSDLFRSCQLCESAYRRKQTLLFCWSPTSSFSTYCSSVVSLPLLRRIFDKLNCRVSRLLGSWTPPIIFNGICFTLILVRHILTTRRAESLPILQRLARE